jgi:hypothetical protein
MPHRSRWVPNLNVTRANTNRKGIQNESEGLGWLTIGKTTPPRNARDKVPGREQQELPSGRAAVIKEMADLLHRRRGLTGVHTNEEDAV